MEAPFKKFGQERWDADNKEFTSFNDMPLIVGQRVKGTWVNCDGRNYGVSGTIDYNPNSDYWVVSDGNTGITPIKLFIFLQFNQDI